MPKGASPPLTLMCGSFKSGSFHEKLKTPFILSIAPDTTDLAASSFEENADLIPSKTDDTVSFAACILDAMVERMLSSLPPVNVLMAE